jgi:hypothetical protein
MAINFDERPPAPEVERVPLFVLDGKEYTIPAKIGPAVGLRYLYDLKLLGEQAAIAGLLFTVLGQDAMEALSNSSQVTMADVNIIMEIVRDQTLGGMETGN